MTSIYKRLLAAAGVALLAVALLASGAFLGGSQAYAYSYDYSQTYTFKAVPSSTTVDVGDEFALDLTLSSNVSDTFVPYAFSAYVDYDPNYFEPTDLYENALKWGGLGKLVSYGTGGSGIIRDEVLSDGNHRLIYQSSISYGKEPTWENGFVFATVHLRAIAEGESSFKFTWTNISNTTGMVKYPSISENATVKSVNRCYKVGEPYVDGWSKVIYKDAVDEGMHPTYNGKAMCLIDGVWTTLVADKSISVLVNSDFALEEGAVSELEPDADVNGNGRVNIVDAQVALDLSNGVTSASLFTAKTLLAADVNEDGVLSAPDARAIQHYIHTGSFNEAA